MVAKDASCSLENGKELQIKEYVDQDAVKNSLTRLPRHLSHVEIRGYRAMKLGLQRKGYRISGSLSN